MSIRIVAYNLSGILDAGAIAEVLRGVRPDVVCATEVPGRLAVRRLARRAGLDVAVAAGRRRTGTAILVGERVRVVSSDHHELTAFPGLPRREVAQAILGIDSTRFVAIAVQLGLRPEVREAHATDLEAIASRVTGRVVIGADLNEAPGGATVERLSAVFTDAFAAAGSGPGETFPNPEPMARKDYVFVDPGFSVLRASVPSAPPTATASHHRPVVAEIAETAEESLPRAEEPAA